MQTNLHTSARARRKQINESERILQFLQTFGDQTIINGISVVYIVYPMQETVYACYLREGYHQSHTMVSEMQAHPPTLGYAAGVPAFH